MYRGTRTSTASPFHVFLAKTWGGVIWGWIIYNFVFHNEHVFGHYVDPDPNLWTDEYLGIPPDEEGLAPFNPNPRSIQIPGVHRIPFHFNPYLIEQRYGENPFKF